MNELSTLRCGCSAEQLVSDDSGMTRPYVVALRVIITSPHCNQHTRGEIIRCA